MRPEFLEILIRVFRIQRLFNRFVVERLRILMQKVEGKAGFGGEPATVQLNRNGNCFKSLLLISLFRL